MPTTVKNKTITNRKSEKEGQYADGRGGRGVGASNGNDIEAKRNESSILRLFLYRSETNKLILKL